VKATAVRYKNCNDASSLVNKDYNFLYTFRHFCVYRANSIFDRLNYRFYLLQNALPSNYYNNDKVILPERPLPRIRTKDFGGIKNIFYL
jgi:hypothetical protein